MTQKLTVLFDLDGTLIDTAPDLMNAHNHVMKKFGYETRSTDEIRNLVGKGAASMIGRSMWNQAKKELKKIDDEEISYSSINNLYEFLDSKFSPNPNLFGNTTIYADMPDWNPAEMIGSHPRPLAFSMYE